MSERREKLEALIKEYHTLNDHLYVGDDLQTDKYDASKKKLAEIDEIVRPRVDMILAFVKTLPQGEWGYTREFGNIVSFFLGGHEYKSLDWISKDNRFGFAWCSGEDDGYPETEYIEIDGEWLLEDDEKKVKREILEAAISASSSRILELDKTLKREKSVLKRLDEIEITEGLQSNVNT